MSAPSSAEAYQRLPGRRRSLWGGSSLWMGSDHILLVKSAWFREEYRRFHLRDIQAIVVAPCARFYVSGPMLLFAIAWLIAGLVAEMEGPRGTGIVWWIASAALFATWLSVSLASSCRCRLYTAVSSEELPSLYRTWTARRFLSKLRPRIEQVQGKVATGWAEAERSELGPATLSPGPPPEPQLETAPRRGHTLASDLFVVSLFVGAAVDYATMRTTNRWWQSLHMLLLLLQLIGAVTVLIQYRARKLGSGMQKMAITAMVLLGVTFYVNNFTYSYVVGQSLSMNGKAFAMPSPVVLLHSAQDILLLLLGLIGAGLTIAASRSGQTDIIKD